MFFRGWRIAEIFRLRSSYEVFMRKGRYYSQLEKKLNLCRRVMPITIREFLKTSLIKMAKCFSEIKLLFFLSFNKKAVKYIHLSIMRSIPPSNLVLSR
jgi:hypothetical protein